MQRVLDAHRRLDQRLGIETSFALANDGVHPAEAGHWIMAKSILMHLGAKEIIKAGTIQATLTNIETQILYKTDYRKTKYFKRCLAHQYRTFTSRNE